jgi:hypothetical protein
MPAAAISVCRSVFSDESQLPDVDEIKSHNMSTVNVYTATALIRSFRRAIVLLCFHRIILHSAVERGPRQNECGEKHIDGVWRRKSGIYIRHRFLDQNIRIAHDRTVTYPATRG